MSTPDFQALFSRLSSASTPVPSPSSASPQQPDPLTTTGNESTPITGPLNSLPLSQSNTLSRSNMASPLQRATSSSNDRAQSLLSLLRFSQPPTAEGGGQPSGQPGRTLTAEESSPVTPHKHETSEAELVTGSAALLAREEGGSRTVSSVAHTTDARTLQAPSSSEENPQEALLRFLSRSHQNLSESKQNETSESLSVEHGIENEAQEVPVSIQTGRKSPMVAPHKRQDSPFRIGSSQHNKGNTASEAPPSEGLQAQQEQKPLFTYTNPFEALNASRVQSVQHSRISSPAIGIRQDNNELTPSNGEKLKPEAGSPKIPTARKKLTPKAPVRPPEPAQHEDMDEIPTEPPNPVNHGPKTDQNVSSETADFRYESDKSHPRAVDHIDKTGVPAGQQSIAEPQPVYKDEDVTGIQNQKVATQRREGATKDVDDAWESADESSAKEGPKRVVPVYNFPIKPFVSITIKPSPPSSVGLRDDGVMDISRYKKEFDQLDRSLAAATSKYITYALVKSGGIRIIRQEDGSDRQVFKNSHDRVVSVAICSTATSSTPSDYQAVLGVGVSGSVYYATISKQGTDFFEEDVLETESLIFPPFPLGDENTSGGVLKTRAKKSSRHPEFFAIGRGKSINLVWPATAMSTKYGVTGSARKVDVEKLYNDRSLKITTGKAGKDFAFSEDDTLIVSLDKTGRLRFWDIRLLVDESNATASKVAPIDIHIPLLTLATASPAEKSWPTSVLFIDKLRPYTKVAALRYVLVGLKQNHTLQLWDIGLSKAVQELNFPHETETDGICSVCYHPNSGIIVVGHPTRNSIYFIHLSAPRYALGPMTQAAYIERLAADDPDLPKPDSTACMSGIREINFAAKGQLRSVELLPIHKGAESTKEVADSLPLFELYVVHSKGVTCLNIRKEDLGWSSDSKVLNPINAAEEGLIAMKDLRLGTVINEPAEPINMPEEVPQSTKGSKKKTSKKAADVVQEGEPTGSADLEVPAEPVSMGEGQLNGAKPGPGKVETPPEKEAKRSKRKGATSNMLAASQVKAVPDSSSRNISPSKPTSTVTPQALDATTATTMETANIRTPLQTMSAAQGEAERVTVGISGDWLDKELKKIEKVVSGEFRKELSDLYLHIQNDRNVQDAAAVARQEAVLRLISTTLSTNIEKSLGRIILSQMQQVVVPSITGVTVQAVSAQVGEAIARVLHQLVPHELGTQLPVAISTAMQNPQISRAISETVSQKVASQVESHMSDLLRTTIAPAFKNLASSVAEQSAIEVENRLGAQILQLQTDRENDSAKIDSLQQVLDGLANTLQAMSTSQVEFQKQILRDRQQLARLSVSTSTNSPSQVSTARQLPPPIATPTPAESRTDSEINDEHIAKLMEEGKYEEASIRWLQSSKPVELFDELFVRFTPDYLGTDVSPLVAFSVGITVGNSLSTNTARRLDWINAAFEAVDLQDPEIADLSQHAPALINSLIQRLEDLYKEMVERNPDDRILRIIIPILHKAVDMRAHLSLEPTQQVASQGYNY